MLHLAHCLNASFSPFQGAPQDILDYHEKVDPMDNILTYPKSNALEVSRNAPDQSDPRILCRMTQG